MTDSSDDRQPMPLDDALRILLKVPLAEPCDSDGPEDTDGPEDSEEEPTDGE